jgi:hypothetical protein
VATRHELLSQLANADPNDEPVPVAVADLAKLTASDLPDDIEMAPFRKS